MKKDREIDLYLQSDGSYATETPIHPTTEVKEEEPKFFVVDSLTAIAEFCLAQERERAKQGWTFVDESAEIDEDVFFDVLEPLTPDKEERRKRRVTYGNRHTFSSTEKRISKSTRRIHTPGETLLERFKRLSLFGM